MSPVILVQRQATDPFWGGGATGFGYPAGQPQPSLCPRGRPADADTYWPVQQGHKSLWAAYQFEFGVFSLTCSATLRHRPMAEACRAGHFQFDLGFEG